MAFSKAQKQRKKAEREGRMNPEEMRLGWNGVNPATKTTPTLAERLRKHESKHRKKRNGCQYDDGSVFCWVSRTHYGKFCSFMAKRIT